MAVKAAPGKVVLKPLIDDKIGLIILSDYSKKKTFKGQVVDIGEGKLIAENTRLPIDISKDSIVIFDQDNATKFEILENGSKVEYFILYQKDILCEFIPNEDKS